MIVKYNSCTAFKASKCGVFSCPYFPVFTPNTGNDGPEKTSYLDTFHARMKWLIFSHWNILIWNQGKAYAILTKNKENIISNNHCKQEQISYNKVLPCNIDDILLNHYVLQLLHKKLLYITKATTTRNIYNITS